MTNRVIYTAAFMLQKTGVETEQTRIKWRLLAVRIVDITHLLSLAHLRSVSIHLFSDFQVILVRTRINTLINGTDITVPGECVQR